VQFSQSTFASSDGDTGARHTSHRSPSYPGSQRHAELAWHSPWPLQPTSRLLQKLKLLLSLLLLPPLPLLLLPPPPPKTDANESICAPSAITGSNCCR
jgi:hypothetical protein